jgi:hypothetical protein
MVSLPRRWEGRRIAMLQRVLKRIPDDQKLAAQRSEHLYDPPGWNDDREQVAIRQGGGAPDGVSGLNAVVLVSWVRLGSVAAFI